MDADGVLYIAGDAADENNLIKAGIARAKAVVAALATDTDNVFLDFINHAIFCYNNIHMPVVSFDGNLGDDLVFKGKRNLAGRDCQPGDESIVITFS